LEVLVKALTWHGKGDIRCESVPDPGIEDSRDAIIKVTACAICGSDLFAAASMWRVCSGVAAT
jgi:threonine dehydrogenase-like Zn-dependent dehydrogenase